jgi:hypothetical protein
MSSNLYSIDSYSDEELFSILDLNNPSDRELEARILFLIHKYENMQNNSGNELVAFFTKIYNHFFESEEEENSVSQKEGFIYEIEEEDNEGQVNEGTNDDVGTYADDNASEGFENMTKEGLANIMDISNAAVPGPIISYANLGSVVSTASSYRSDDIGFVKPLDYAKDKLNPLLQQTIKRIISIDSQYRDNKQSLSTDFTFNLSDPLRDVVSLKLYSVQIPYTWYTINTAFGSNVFYIKGNSPGINVGNFDFMIDISAGNYTPNELVTSINKSIGRLTSQYSDISFGNTAVSYNSNTSLITTTIDITQKYSENSYEYAFSKWTTPNDNGKKSTDPRFQSIPGYLGFNYQYYYPNMIRSTPSLPYIRDSLLEDTTVRKYYVDGASNYYFTVIKYDGPDELTMNPGTHYYDMSFVNYIDLSFQIALSIRKDSTRSLLFTDVSNQISACPYLTADSGITRINISNPLVVGDQNSYFQITLKPNRYTTNNRTSSKMAIVFPYENIQSGYNPIWTGPTSCFRFSDINHIYELNTIISETSPVTQKSNYYTIKSNPYIYLRCITPGFAITSDDVSSNYTVGPVNPSNIYIYQDFSNNISRYPITDDFGNTTYDYVTGNDLSCNDYIIPLPNSAGIGYTITDYINAINTSIKTRNTYTINASNIAGDINAENTGSIVDNNSVFNIQFDINKKFNQDKYMVDLTNTYFNQVMGLPLVTADLSASNIIESRTFIQSNYYTLSGDYLAIIKPAEIHHYGNRHQGPYIIPLPPKNYPSSATSDMSANSTWQYDTYQDLQKAINYQFQTFTDPDDNTRVLSGTNINFTFNPKTIAIDCSFTVVVQKILTEKDYSIQFIDPSLSTYHYFYSATKVIDKNAIYFIDASYSYYTDISTAYNIAYNRGILPAYSAISSTVAKQLTYKTYYTDLSSAYNGPQKALLKNTDLVIDASSVFILGQANDYYTDLSSIYNDPALPNIRTIHRQADPSNIYVLDKTMNYYTDISSAFNYNKNLLTTYISVSQNETYVLDSSLSYIVASSNPYPNMTPVLVNNPANVYLLDSDFNYYYYTTNQTYYIDLLTVSNIPYSSIWFINKRDGKLYYISNAVSIYGVTSPAFINNRVTDNIYLMDISANYYYDLSASNYFYDPNISTVIDPSFVFYVGRGGDSKFHIFQLYANSIMTIDSSAVIQVEAAKNMYLITDSTSNYYRDVRTNKYHVNSSCQTEFSSPTSSIYLLGKNLLTTGNPGITYGGTSILGNTHIYRYDISANSSATTYTINSAVTTISQDNPSGFYVLDNSTNYYLNKSTNSYMIDSSFITPIGNTIYYIDVSGSANYLYKYMNTTGINYVNSSSVIYNDVSNIYLIDSPDNYHIDSSHNYNIDPVDSLYKPESHKSIYFIYNVNYDASLNSKLGNVRNTKVIRVDVSNAYVVDVPLRYHVYPDYTTTTWSNNLKVDSENMIRRPFTLAGVDVSNAETGVHYASVNGIGTIDQNRFTLDKTNNILTLTPYEAGVIDYAGRNTIVIELDVSSNVVANSYTRDGLLALINKTIQKTIPGDAYGTNFSVFTDTYGNEYTKLRVNVNKIYSAADYKVSYYDTDSFVKCYVGVTSVRNTTWDSTLGWILGYRKATIYSLSDYGIHGVPLQITADTGISTNLFNYFMICLDDYNQNHLNDGLVTVTTKDIDISLPSYANRTQFQCDPVTGNKTYSSLPDSAKNSSNLTQNQIYSLTQIANSKSNVIKTNSTGTTINSKSYGLGPFVKDVFGLIPMKLAGLQNGQYFVEFGGTLQNQDRTYFGPVNIHRMTVKLVSDRGDVVDLNGANWSFALVCEQLYRGGGKPSK